MADQEKQISGLVVDVILIFLAIAALLFLVIPGVRTFASRLGELPRSFLGSILDRIGWNWWG